MNNPLRSTVYLEDAPVEKVVTYPDLQFVITLRCEKIARQAKPGQFVHIECDELLPMRRPLSIMRVDKQTGSIDLLFKVVGKGTKILSECKVGDVINCMGPVGIPFWQHPEHDICLLVGGGVGIPPIVFLAQQLQQENLSGRKIVVFLGSEIAFPFPVVKSVLSKPELADEINMAMNELEKMSITSRLASQQDLQGVYNGYVTELAKSWLDKLTVTQQRRVSIYGCGPNSMLHALSKWALSQDIPCQVCMEAHMACAIGGCAGCTIPLQEGGMQFMSRVCVDGPVFAAEKIMWENL